MEHASDHGSHSAPVRRPAPARAGALANILAIVGFIILIIIVVWGLIHLARLSTPWFKSLFDKSAIIEITAPANAQSGKPIQVSWEHEADVAGTYAFLYRCEEGLVYAFPGAQGAFNAAPCGTSFTLGAATGTVTILPVLNSSTSVQSRISIIFMPADAANSEKQVEDTATITVTPGAPVPTAPNQPATTTPPVSSPNPTPATPRPTPTPTPNPRPATPADLSVTILSVTEEPGGVKAVSFDIKNVGGTTSGTYYFTAQLPTSQPYTFSSQPQSPLSPGSHVVSTLRFSQPVSGTFSVSVRGDSNTSNNYASRWIEGSYYQPQPTPYYNPNPYPYYGY